jgi:hypothetical protein
MHHCSAAAAPYLDVSMPYRVDERVTTRLRKTIEYDLTPASKAESSSLLILTSTHRWDASQFRIPGSERPACLAPCRTSF